MIENGDLTWFLFSMWEPVEWDDQPEPDRPPTPNHTPQTWLDQQSFSGRGK
jgi:hypothetical protein